MKGQPIAERMGRIVNRYQKKIGALADEIKVEQNREGEAGILGDTLGHFTHITSSLLCTMYTDKDTSERGARLGDKIEKVKLERILGKAKEAFLSMLKSLRTYSQLIRFYPDFREVETKRDITCYFLEAESFQRYDYIEYAKNQLEGRES